MLGSPKAEVGCSNHLGCAITSMIWRRLLLLFLKTRVPRYARATCSPGVPMMGATDPPTM